MDSNTGSLFLLKRIELLSENDSLDKADPNDLSVAQEIVKEMDGLPLALDQAGAYIRQTQSRLQEYLDLYKNAKHAAKLRDKRGKHTDDHISVTATFQLAFNKVKQKNSTVTKVLEVCSFLDPNLIPEEIFTHTQTNNFLNDGLAALVDDPFLWPEVLEALSDYSLVKRDTSNKSLSIHRLVQAVIRDLLTEDNKKLLVDSLAKALDSLSNDDAEDPNNWPTYQRLLPSVTSLFNFTKFYQSNVIEAAYLFHPFGIYCYKQALFPQSLDFSNLVLKIKKQCFGNKHPDIANTFINISSIYKTQGKYTQALDSLTQALNIKKFLYGDKHPDIALILNNMGTIYDSIGEYAKALDYYKQALSIRKDHFGDNHPDVAQTLNNIALVYKTQGKYDDALDYIKQVLSIRKKSFGDNHPDVADTLINIGEIYREKGCYVDALNSYNQALSISKNYFDDDHLHVAEILENIAIVYQAQNKHDAALDYLKKSLSTYKKYFGEHHPSVAKALENIGNSYLHNKQYKLALDNYKQTLSIRKDYFGEIHRDVAGTLNNIAGVHYYQNNFKDALSSFNQALSIRKKLFGDNHPDVAQTLNNIALIYQAQDKYNDALSHFQESLNIFDQFFPFHPEVIEVVKSYSQLLLKLKRNSEAQPLLNRLKALSNPIQQSNQRPSINNSTFNISFASPLKPKK